MSVSRNSGTASLSKSQRLELSNFRRRNHKNLQGLYVHQIVQIWRDGYICGAIHGHDFATAYFKKNRAPVAKKRSL